MTSRLRKTLDWTLGLGLIGLGIVGAFVPILQGWVFIVAGLAVLSSHSRIARRLNDRLKMTVRSVRSRLSRGRRAAADPPDSSG